MSSDNLAPSVADLREEMVQPYTGRDPMPATLTEAPGEPLFSSGEMARLFALAATTLAEPPGPCGQDLLTLQRDLTSQSMSPGTLYPVLHDLDDAGALAKTELVRTKRYAIADADAADTILENYERRLRWWLGLCLLAREALDGDSAENTS